MISEQAPQQKADYHFEQPTQRHHSSTGHKQAQGRIKQPTQHQAQQPTTAHHSRQLDQQHIIQLEEQQQSQQQHSLQLDQQQQQGASWAFRKRQTARQQFDRGSARGVGGWGWTRG